MSSWRLALCVSLVACSAPSPPARDAASDAPSDLAPITDASRADAPDDAPSACGDEAALPAFATRSPDGISVRCGAYELRASALSDGVVRLRYVTPGREPEPRSWAVIHAERAALRVGATLGRAALCGDGISATIDRDCRVRVTDATGRTLLDDGDDGGFARDGARAAVTRQTPAGERFYGFGERNGPLERRGTRMVFYNTDPYDTRVGGVNITADPLYQSIPFFVGVRPEGSAYGVFSDDAHRMEIDLAARAPNRYEVASVGGTIDQYVFAGPTMPEVLRRYTALTGRMPEPPRWAIGYHQCRWGYANSARVEAVAAEFRRREIPLDAVWLDIQHMEGFRTFTFDPTSFGDARAMMARLAAADVHTVLIADPGLKQDENWSVYRDGVSGNHFLRRADGALYVGNVWPGPSVFPDFTREATRRWWGDHVADLSRMGVGGLWLDVNEPTVFPESGGGSVPDTLPVDGDGTPTTMAEAHNVYGMNEARATWEGQLRAAPERTPFVLTRAGYAGIQRYAAVWTGDAPSAWNTLRGVLPMLLNLGLSGVAFAGSDVGGYSGHASPELFARWMSLGSISPFFRGHVTQGVPDQEPWAFGIEVEDISRARITQRMRWSPLFESLFHQASQTGAPVLRPLAWSFPDDPASARIDDQAMLGDFIMAAPVLTEGAERRTVHLPPGRWYELSSSAIWEGPADLTVGVTLAALPIFVRAGAIIPSAALSMHAALRDGSPLELDVYPGAPGSLSLPDDRLDASPFRPRGTTDFALTQDPRGVYLSVRAHPTSYTPPARRDGYVVRVHRIEQPPSEVRAGSVVLAEITRDVWLRTQEPGWRYDANDLTVWVRGEALSEGVLSIVCDPRVIDPRPLVDISLDVELPAGTPHTAPVFVATNVSGWRHSAMVWDATTGHAYTTVSVPRGEWFFYKYTRGDWDTVERYPDCSEARNRYAMGAALPSRRDRVWTWRDRCP